MADCQDHPRRPTTATINRREADIEALTHRLQATTLRVAALKTQIEQAITFHANGGLNHFLPEAVVAKYECNGCRDEYVEADALCLRCGHYWCRECLDGNVKCAMRMRGSWPPKCCERIIGGQRDTPRILDFLPVETVETLRAKLPELEAKNPTYCPQPKCGKFLGDLAFPLHSDFTYCFECDIWVCVKCKRDEDEHAMSRRVSRVRTCQSLLSDADRERIMRGEEQQCPGCLILIQKTEACDHMTCVCGMDFCYVCGRELMGPLYQCVQGCMGGAPRIEFDDQAPVMVRDEARVRYVGPEGLVIRVPVRELLGGRGNREMDPEDVNDLEGGGDGYELDEDEDDGEGRETGDDDSEIIQRESGREIETFPGPWDEYVARQ